MELVVADITILKVDAIVNAANSRLAGGGGVDGAIHRAAGRQLNEACREIIRSKYRDGLPVGHAVATPGFNLSAKYIIHTVGPNRHRGQNNPADLRSCFVESLRIGEQLNVSSIAFPAISAGVYGWSMREVAKIGIDVANSYRGSIKNITFCLFSSDAYQIWREVEETSQL